MHSRTFLLAVGLLALSGAQVDAQTSSPPRPDSADRELAQPPRINPDLIGVWRVVRFCLTDSLGVQHEPFRQAIGYFIYTRGGRLSLQFSPGTANSPVPAASLAALPPDERPSFENGYVAYFGTYTVTSDSTLVHHVEGSTFASYFGTDRPRPYRISGARRDMLAAGDLHPGCRVPRSR